MHRLCVAYEEDPEALIINSNYEFAIERDVITVPGRGVAACRCASGDVPARMPAATCSGAVAAARQIEQHIRRSRDRPPLRHAPHGLTIARRAANAVAITLGVLPTAFKLGLFVPLPLESMRQPR